MWDESVDDSTAKKGPPGSYDHLLDAEREVLARTGRGADKIALIRALREASPISLRDAKRAVEGYIARRGGRLPAGSDVDRPGGWIDDLLDAERASARRDDRPINRIMLIKAVREASTLDHRQAKAAVVDYLARKGGEGLESGERKWWIALGVFSAVLFVALAAVVAYALTLE